MSDLVSTHYDLNKHNYRHHLPQNGITDAGSLHMGLSASNKLNQLQHQSFAIPVVYCYRINELPVMPYAIKPS